MHELAAAVAPVLLDLLATVLVLLVAQGIRYLQARTQSAYLDAALERLESAASVAVRDIHQTMREDFKSAAADGKLTADEAELLRNAALSSLRQYLGKHGLEELKRVVPPKDIEDFLRAKVEAVLVDLKSQLVKGG